MNCKRILDLNEEIEINLIEYYSSIKSRINKDIVDMIDEPDSIFTNDELNKVREFGDQLILRVNSILESSIDEVEKYFSNLKKLNVLFNNMDDLNDFFQDENKNKDEISVGKIDEESIQMCALTKYAIYVSKSKLNSKSIASHKKPGVFVFFDYYPNKNEINYIRSIFEGRGPGYCFDKNILDLKYQLDKQITVFEDIKMTSQLELVFTHINVASIIEVKNLDISGINSIEISFKSQLEAEMILKLDMNTFKSFNNLQFLKFSGFIEDVSNFETYTNKKIFHLSHHFNVFNTIKLLTNLIKLTIRKFPIESIENSIFNNLINLRELDLSNNNIKKVKKENFEGLNNLMHLNLSNNSIDELTEFPFQHLRGLKMLNISSNNINDLKLDSFGYSMINLEYLDLSNNNFKEIRKNVLKNLVGLKEIFLPEYFVNYSFVNLNREIGVDIKTRINIGKS